MNNLFGVSSEQIRGGQQCDEDEDLITVFVIQQVAGTIIIL
jgi:hypothetical protein